MVRIYGPGTTERRGGTVTLNFYDANGHFIDHPVIERRAGEHRISLRTGCFCNPGAGELALGLSKGELFHCMREVGDNVAHITYEDFRRCIDDKSTGAVRISFGWASTFADAEAFLAFAREMRAPAA